MPATLTYSSPLQQNPAGILRAAPCDPRRYSTAPSTAYHHVQPLKGLPGTRATDVSYRALAPGGAGFCYRICTGTSESRLTAHYSLLTANSTFTFSAKERDPETGLSYFGSRYYSSDLSIWLSVDPMSDKYPSMSPYVYCANNPVKLVDPNGETWVDADGNEITDHSKIKVYIFYDPKSFDKQSRKMYKAAEKKYGVGSVALSDATTENDFAKDWGDMAGSNIQEVDLNYHGNNQTLMLNSAANQYITATGNGETNISGTKAKNVGDLPTPKGNISIAQLNINSCKSNSKTQYELKGSGLTLMQAFASAFKFKSVRGTSAGVSYNRFSGQPEPQNYYEQWEYIPPRPIKGNSSYNMPLYYRTGGVR